MSITQPGPTNHKSARIMAGATYMETPVGPLPIRSALTKRFATMSDREMVDETFRSQPGFINPEAFAEIVARGLCSRGDFEQDVYRRLAEREAEE